MAQSAFGPDPSHTGSGLSVAVQAVADAGTAGEFLGHLNALRTSLGLSYTQIAAKAGKGMSRSTAHAMLNGDDLPSRKHLHQFLRACKVSQDELNLWTRTWEQLPAALNGHPVSHDDAVVTPNGASEPSTAPEPEPAAPPN